MNQTSKLDAVNTLLATISDAPVSTLDGERTAEVALAINTVEEVTRSTLSVGLPFNTDTDYPLPVNGDGKVALPPNVAKVTFSPSLTDPKPVQRGSYLYDTKNQTFTFSDTMTASSIVWLLDFDDCPESVRQFITIRACRLFQDRVQGSDAQHMYSERDESQSKRNMLADIGRLARHNMLNDLTSLSIIQR